MTKALFIQMTYTIGPVATGIVIAFLGITLIAGLVVSKGMNSLKKYALGDKKYGAAALTFTFVATFIGAATTTGGVANIFQDGLIYTLVHIASIIAFLFFAFGISHKMHHFRDCISVGSIMNKLYGKNTRIISSSISIITSLLIISAQILALSFVCELLPGINKNMAVTISGFIVVLYSVRGGIKSVAFTDFIQFAVLVLVIPLLAFTVLAKTDGVIELFKQVPVEKLQFTNHSKFNYYLVIALVWELFNGTLISPPAVQRMLMAQNTKDLRNMFLASLVILLIYIIFISLIGFSGVVLHPTINPNNLFPTFIQYNLPPIMQGIVVAGLFAVIMSSADSFLNSVGILMIHDIIQPIQGEKKEPISTSEEEKNQLKNKKDQQDVKMARYTTFFIGVLSITIALFAQDIVHLVMYSAAIANATITFPLLSGIMGLKSTAKDFFTGFFVTLAVFVVSLLILPGESRYYFTLFCLIANFISFFGSHFIRNKVSFKYERINNQHIAKIVSRGDKAPITQQNLA